MQMFGKSEVDQYSIESILSIPDSSYSGSVRRKVIARVVNETGSEESLRSRIELLPTLPQVLYRAGTAGADKRSMRSSLTSVFAFILKYFTTSIPLFFSVILAIALYAIDRVSNRYTFIDVSNEQIVLLVILASFTHIILRTPALLKYYSSYPMYINMLICSLLAYIVSLSLGLVISFISLSIIFAILIKRVLYSKFGMPFKQACVNLPKNVLIDDRELLDLNEHPKTLASFISSDLDLATGFVEVDDAVAAVIGHDLLLIGCDIVSTSQITSIGPSAISAYSAILCRASGFPVKGHPVFAESGPWPTSLPELESRFNKLVDWALIYVGPAGLRYVLYAAAEDLSFGSTGFDRSSRVASFLLDKLSVMFRE